MKKNNLFKKCCSALLFGIILIGTSCSSNNTQSTVDSNRTNTVTTQTTMKEENYMDLKLYTMPEFYALILENGTDYTVNKTYKIIVPHDTRGGLRYIVPEEENPNHNKAMELIILPNGCMAKKGDSVVVTITEAYTYEDCPTTFDLFATLIKVIPANQAEDTN